MNVEDLCSKDLPTASKDHRPRKNRRRQLKRKHVRKAKMALKIEIKLHRALSFTSKETFPSLCGGAISPSVNAFSETPYKTALEHRQEPVVIVPQSKSSERSSSLVGASCEKFNPKRLMKSQRLSVASARILIAKVKRVSGRYPAVDIYRDRRRRLRALKNLKTHEKNSLLSIESNVFFFVFQELDNFCTQEK